jgi:hypothetical protein
VFTVLHPIICSSRHPGRSTTRLLHIIRSLQHFRTAIGTMRLGGTTTSWTLMIVRGHGLRLSWALRNFLHFDLQRPPGRAVNQRTTQVSQSKGRMIPTKMNHSMTLDFKRLVTTRAVCFSSAKRMCGVYRKKDHGQHFPAWPKAGISGLMGAKVTANGHRQIPRVGGGRRHSMHFRCAALSTMVTIRSWHDLV